MKRDKSEKKFLRTRETHGAGSGKLTFFIWGVLSVSDGEGNGTPLQYSCLENPTDGGARWAAVHGVAKSQTRLSDFTVTFHFHASEKAVAPHSRVLTRRIPGTAGPGGLPSMGSHRVGRDWSDLAAAVSGTVHEGCDSHWKRNPVLPCHLRRGEKRATTQTSLDHFLKRADRIESSKEPEPVPTLDSSGCNRSAPADDPRLYHLPPPASPPASSSSCLLTQGQPPYAGCCSVLLCLSRYCTVRWKKKKKKANSFSSHSR